MTAETKVSEKKLFIVSWVILAAYSALTLLGALNHELWLDEAQAWVILRDAPLSELPGILNTEGHPPLWYAILYPFVKLGSPAEHVSLISWFIMALGAVVLMFKVKLPLPLKAVILASSGFLYLNSVMLRVYCLIPPLLFLILWIYPKRREHAVLYGLLIALLANTHVFICGIVGILGIYMIYDLFAEWKNSPKNENIGKLIGLAIAGVGVLILVIPLLGSIQANGATDMSSGVVRNTFFETLDEVFAFSVFGNNQKLSIITFIFFLILKVAFLAMIAVLRHWRRAFAVEIGFVAIYYVACGMIWTTLANRAVIFILSLAFSFCLTQFEKPIFKEYKMGDRIGGAIRAFLTHLIEFDKKAAKVYLVILTAFFVITIPSGAVLLYRDITSAFSGAEETAEYITENLEDDAVLIDLNIGMPEISFYDPDIRIFSVYSCGFNSYACWKYANRPRETVETVLRTLSEYDDLYIIYYYKGDDYQKSDTIFLAQGMREYDYHNSIAICKYNEEEIMFLFKYYDELNRK